MTKKRMIGLIFALLIVDHGTCQNISIDQVNTGVLGVGSCKKDSDCALTLACLESTCSDPCDVPATTPCPMKGGICKVVGHRPVCSCPSGSHNINNSCTSDTSCQWDDRRYDSGEHYYDDNCEHRCECYNGEFICQPTTCQAGLKPKGQLTKENEECIEKPHPGGDECCVLWVCKDEEDKGTCVDMDCGDHSSCDYQLKQCVCDRGYIKDDGGCVRSTQDETNIKLLQITPNSIQVQFPDITGGNLMYIETRVLVRKDPPWENAILVEGNEIFTLTGLNPDTEYTLRWKAPDKQYPDIQTSTLAIELDQKPKIIMTNRTHDAVMLSFDPFSPEDYQHGYIASWKTINQSAWMMGEKETTGDTPSIVIDGLEPDTEYVAKISVYEDYANRVLGRSTEDIQFRTLPGCKYKNSEGNSSSYPVGKFHVSCESSCECLADGQVQCDDRCKLPHYRRGEFQDDPLCVERPVDESGCCVLVLCAADTEEDENSPCQDVVCGPNAECKREVFRDSDNTICVCKEGFTGDPDSLQGCSQSSDLDEEVIPEDACITQNSTYLPGQTWYDGCEYKCSCNNKEILCEARCKIITENVDESCELTPDPNDSCCQIMVCPSVVSSSVLQPSLPTDGCQFKNFTYSKDERWYDGCDQQCQCMGFGDVFCLPRCQPIKPELGEDCYTLPDVTDSCCNVTVCDKPKHEVPDVVKILSEEQGSSNSEKQPRMNDLPDEGSTLYIGKFLEMHHGVQGKVYAHNESVLVVKDFSYDGEGVDVFFWATRKNSADGDEDGVILPYPYEGKFYASDDPSAPVLPKLVKKTIILNIPSKLLLEDIKQLSVFSREFKTTYASVQLPDFIEMARKESKVEDIVEIIDGCKFKGQVYKFGEEFYDNCDSYCICQDNGEPYCSDIKCPSEFGLDVINPNCILWNKHEDFVATAPFCCPPISECLSDGSCNYKGANFTNYDSIPMELTGCEKRCHCEDGEIKCRDACYKISDSPPKWLQCSAEDAIKKPNEDRPCCLNWGCSPTTTTTTTTILPPTGKLNGASAIQVNDTCISITFDVPPDFEGKEGWFGASYSTPGAGHPDPSRWPSLKTILPDGKIPNSGLGSAVVCSLVPNYEYLFRPFLVLKGYEDFPVNGDITLGKINVHQVTQAPVPISYLDMELEATLITSNSAKISWRYFDQKTEKPFIDSVQLRYKILNKTSEYPLTIVPETSPFIHRETNFYVFDNLTPDTKYEFDLDIYPVSDAEIEFFSGKNLIFITPEHIDPYDFKPELSILNIGENSVEVGWQGIPSPDQKFVNVYRVIYHTINRDDFRKESSVFKISKIDSPKKLNVSLLDSDVEYQIWLESYLTNGKIVKSNVVEFRTKKASDAPVALPKNDESDSVNNTSDYYQSMVAASVIAALALLLFVIILYFYLKRYRTTMATITKPSSVSTTSKSSVNGYNDVAAYDNPAFKGFENNGNINQNIPPGSTFELGSLENQS